MLQVQQRTANGLIAQANPLTAGEGSCIVAENVVVDRDGVTGKRRGFNRYATVSTTGSLAEFGDKLIVLDGTTLKHDDGTGTLSSYSGTYETPDGYRLRSLEVGKGFLFATAEGVQKLDSLSGTPRLAGMPAALLPLLTVGSVGTWLPNTYQVAYRIVWTHTDANGRVIFGAPSSNEGTTNSEGSSKGVTLTFPVPDGILLGDSYEIYRSDVAVGSPGDDLYLIKSAGVTSGELSAKSVTFVDSYAVTEMDLPLYTNATQEGILQANDRPPLCMDICNFRGYTFYLNCYREHRKEIRLQSLSGIATDDSESITLTMEDSSEHTYIFSTAESVANKKFKVYLVPTDVATEVEAIRETIKSLIRVMNSDTANTHVYGYYSSGEDDPAGKMTFKLRTPGEGAFSITATAVCGWKFTPAIPTTGIAILSSNIGAKNRMSWSKFEEPEHVPEANFKDVGSEYLSGGAILRGFGLQASLIILKEDGIWRQTGDTDTDFDLRPLDPSVAFLCKDGAVALDNNVYSVSRQGLVRCSENGVAIISWPVETEFKKVFSFPGYATKIHATSYQSERKFIVWAPESTSDSYARIGWVYNHLTNKWVTWRKDLVDTHVLKNQDILYGFHAADGEIIKERKSYGTSLSDFQDESIPITVSTVSTTTDADGFTVTTCRVTYTYTGMDIDEGFVLEQSATYMASKVVTATEVTTGVYDLVLEEHLPQLIAGSATLNLPIVSTVIWKPEACGNAAVSKYFSTVQIFFENDNSLKHECGFYSDHRGVGFHTDIMNEITYYDFTMTATQGWGLEPFSEFPWGDSDPSVEPITRMDVPTQFSRGRTLTVCYRHSTAKECFSILNMAISYRQTSERTTQVPR